MHTVTVTCLPHAGAWTMILERRDQGVWNKRFAPWSGGAPEDEKVSDAYVLNLLIAALENPENYRVEVKYD
jgi:hypothetical protein